MSVRQPAARRPRLLVSKHRQTPFARAVPRHLVRLLVTPVPSRDLRSAGPPGGKPSLRSSRSVSGLRRCQRNSFPRHLQFATGSGPTFRRGFDAADGTTDGAWFAPRSFVNQELLPRQQAPSTWPGTSAEAREIGRRHADNGTAPRSGPPTFGPPAIVRPTQHRGGTADAGGNHAAHHEPGDLGHRRH